MTPNDLIKAILKAPVDLLWNGGIGTYVKSTKESNADVGDRANDQVRINGSDVRARVVGEGGNLGFTQLGRIEYALGGGRINTDFIDNSAGVDTSDHEVNWKILLGLAMSRGELTLRAAQRAAAIVRGRCRRRTSCTTTTCRRRSSRRSWTSRCERIDAYEDLMQQLVADGELERDGRVPTQHRGDARATRERTGHGAPRARRAARVREAFDRRRAPRVRPAGLRVPRAERSASLLPARDRRAVRASDLRAPAEARADRDDRGERRRELRGDHVRLSDGDRDRLASGRRRARLPDRSRRHRCRGALGGDRGARRRDRPARADPS